MRRLLIPATTTLAAALALSACGATATLHQAVASVSASPDVQVHLSASYDGPDATAKSVVDETTLDLLASNPSGGALSQAGTNVDTEVIVSLAGQVLADVRSVGTDDYVEVNFDALTGVAGVNVSASEVAAAQLLLGGRWFEVPQSLLESSLPTSASATAAAAKDRTIEREIVSDITGVIESTPYTTLPNGGFSETGTLASIVTALRPTIASLTGSSAATSTVTGDYTLTLTMSGSTATGASVAITAPDSQGGSATIGLTATVAHASTAVVAPSGATIVTPALVKEIEAGVD